MPWRFREARRCAEQSIWPIKCFIDQTGPELYFKMKTKTIFGSKLKLDTSSEIC